MFRTYVVRLDSSTHHCNLITLCFAFLYHSLANIFSDSSISFRVIGSYVR